MSSGKYGLASDAMVGAYIVLANSTLVHTSATENPDIFWAIRGAGSNFGVVTSFEFKTFAQPSQVTFFSVNTKWNSNNMESNLAILENYTRTVQPADLTMRWAVNGANANNLEGLYYGTSAALSNALAPLLNSVNPKLSVSSSTTTDFVSPFKHYSYTNDNDPTFPYSYVSSPDGTSVENL